MVNKWTGTIEDRMARLEHSGRRCDANSRHCTRGAVNVYTLLPADGNFIPIPGGEPVRKKSCAYHRAQFIDNGVWKVVGDHELRRAPSFKEQQQIELDKLRQQGQQSA